MKRLTVILIIILVIGLTACNNEQKPSSEGYENNLLMVYFCGSDLESKNGRASANIEELLNAYIPDNTKIIIQTGGARKWKNDDINGNFIERFEIADNGLCNVYHQPLNNMGEEETLTEFLNYCAKNYPDTNKSLILWNHGGGALKGCCFDENYNFDSLLITEIAKALKDADIPKLDFVGFDACLMGTVEVAYILKDCAKYMVASQELEPGCGWDYKAVAESYGKNTLKETLIGIVDSYYEKCEKLGKALNATLSVIDLSEIENLANTFSKLFNTIQDNIDSVGLYSVTRPVSKASSFGGRTAYESNSNLIDLYGFADNLKLFPDKTDLLKTAINDCVIYKKNGALKQTCGGLSFYYPCNLNSSELKEMATLVVSEEYKAFLKDNYVDVGKEFIRFENYGSINESGAFEITLSKQSLKFVRAVKYSLLEFAGTEFEPIIASLGTDVDIYNETPKVYTSNFKGRWVTLNGETLQCSYLGEENGYDIYSSPVKVNGEPKYLRFAFSYATRNFKLLGVWAGISDSGMADKSFDDLKKGDIVTPVYYTFDANYECSTIDGNRIIISENIDFQTSPLKEKYYQYVFVVEDIFGHLYYSRSAVLEMKYTYDELLANPLTGKYDFAADIIAISDNVALVP
ncbi:MAG TPA: clostripain-related cysteine peptidase [Clostridia bacterium]|nr:clostripain-related cysteine peptidase [Clostridia bacterium]HQC69098.1 clostripain-related cysteine peptidase [Clostridia bacterium]